MNDDTRYFHAALDEYRARTGDGRPAGEIPIRLLGGVLRRAQELKELGDRGADPRVTQGDDGI